jgi:AcrR family transcriptional regulator
VLLHGPSVSTNVIGKENGMSQGALFKRFGTKEHLFISAFSQMADSFPLIDRLREGPTADPIPDQMIELGTELLALFRHLVPCMSMLAATSIARDLMSGPSSPPVVGRKAWTQWFQIAQDQGRARAFDPAAMAVAFTGMLHARPFREFVIRDKGLTCSDEDYVSEIVRVLWCGMAPKRAP